MHDQVKLSFSSPRFVRRSVRRFILLTGILAFRPPIVGAHCDTYWGPIITEARQALENGDMTPLLKWVKKEDEGRVKAVFKKVISVTIKGAEAKEIAENYFFEFLVRLHRRGEKAALLSVKNKPADPINALADKALEKGDVDLVTQTMVARLKEEIKDRFMRALEAQKNSEKDVEAGREYVDAYIDYAHYVERLHHSMLAKSERRAENLQDAETGVDAESVEGDEETESGGDAEDGQDVTRNTGEKRNRVMKSGHDPEYDGDAEDVREVKKIKSAKKTREMESGENTESDEDARKFKSAKKKKVGKNYDDDDSDE